MQRLVTVSLVGAICLFAGAANAVHTRANLILSATSAKRGDTVVAGVHLKMDKGWHTYWRNAGEAGIPTTIEWELPPGITAGEIQWPVPVKAVTSDLTTYEYHDEVVLLVPIKVAAGASAGPLNLRAKVSWLECATDGACVPGDQQVETTLQIGSGTESSQDATLIEAWTKKLPQPGTATTAVARWEKPPAGSSRSLIVEWQTAGSLTDPDFFPDPSEQYDVKAATEILPAESNQVRLRKVVQKLTGDWPRQISGVLIQKSGPAVQGFSVTLALSSGAETETKAAPVAPPESSPTNWSNAKSLWTMLLYAFLGGVILNIMPCVLPVIALKILGFVSQAKEAPGHVRKLGLIYALGVLASFLGLAVLVIAVKAAGHKAGWGMQFSNPQFIVGFTVLVTLVALNLFGVFEVTVSGRVMGAAGGLASKHGASGAFFNGVLATVLATPCTAPFLGAALGFAFAQSSAVIVLMFLTIGAGLAAPYVVLSWNPAWLKFLPRPGAWMEHFKIAMGFPMLATAVWLFSLTTTFYGERSWWLGIFLVLVGAAAWVFGVFVQRGNRRRWLGAIAAILLLSVGYAWALDGRLDWRSPVKESVAQISLAHAPKGYAWQPWNAGAVSEARSQGRAVIVDFTAKWCVTCNATVKPALERKEVIAKLDELQAVALVADNTRFPPAIAEELARFDRAGVPLVLVYPRDAKQPPLVLPEPLSPSPAHYAGVILDALKKAAL